MEPLSHDEIARDQPPLTEAQQAELERRLTTLDQDRPDGVAWAALKVELDQRCP
jgi:putative addiction module component (TIGR02574 family)